MIKKILQSKSLNTKRILRDYRFWVVVFIIPVLALVYHDWPWRNWAPLLYDYAIIEFRFNIIGSLYLIPIIYSALVFWWRGTLFIWILSMAAFIPMIIRVGPSNESTITNITFLLVPLLVVSILTVERNWRERARITAAEREAERQDYILKVFKAQEDERQRISRELHDSATQTLLAIANRAEILVNPEGEIIPALVQDNVEWIRDTVLAVSEDVRRISLDLRPQILDNMGMVPAIRWLASRVNTDKFIDVQTVIKGTERKLVPDTEVLIFRIVQEALNNIQRHSRASNASVFLIFTPKSLHITIQDNGVGFNLKKTLASLAVKDKLGIAGIQQRVNFLNGTFRIHTLSRKGTVLNIKLIC